MYTSEIYNKLDDADDVARDDDDEADEEMKAFITHFANDGQRQRVWEGGRQKQS